MLALKCVGAIGVCKGLKTKKREFINVYLFNLGALQVALRVAAKDVENVKIYAIIQGSDSDNI